MRCNALLLFVALLCAGMLAADWAAAATLSVGQAGFVEQDSETVVARRRRRPRRRKRKPRPKPAKPPPKPAPAPEPAAAGRDPASTAEKALPLGPGGRTRVDFDAQLIKGQTTKAGEVQILERKDTELKSMVKRRTSFREEIILSVFPDKAGKL